MDGRACYVAGLNISETESTILKLVGSYEEKRISVGPYAGEVCMGNLDTVWVLHLGKTYITKIVNDVVEKTIELGFVPKHMCVDKLNTLWLTGVLAGSTTGHLLKIVNDKVDKNIELEGEATAMCVDEANKIWIAITPVGSQTSTAMQFNNGVKVTSVVVGQLVSHLCAAPGIVWAGSQRIVLRILDGKLDGGPYLPLAASASIGCLTGLWVDRANNLWIADSTQGQLHKVVGITGTKVINVPGIMNICANIDGMVYAVCGTEGTTVGRVSIIHDASGAIVSTIPSIPMYSIPGAVNNMLSFPAATVSLDLESGAHIYKTSAPLILTANVVPGTAGSSRKVKLSINGVDKTTFAANPVAL